MHWPPYRDSKADVSSVSPSSERINSLRRRVNDDEGPTQHHSFFRNLPPLVIIDSLLILQHFSILYSANYD